MKKEIVINASKDRARIAIVEDGELVELYVEHPDNVRTLGNIYLGKVAKVMPQIHAAFVDIDATPASGRQTPRAAPAPWKSCQAGSQVMFSAALGTISS